MKSTTAKYNRQLIQARRERHWSQKHVADLLGISALTISRWERGQTAPVAYYRRQLVKLFERTEQQLGLVITEAARMSERTSSSIPHTSSVACLFDSAIPHSLSQPVGLVGRDSLIASLKARILEGHEENPSSSMALVGLPGVGKTALAIALTNDTNIQSHFDGVLWARLGQYPDPPVSQLIRWALLLGIPVTEQPDPEQLALSIRGASATRRLLIVIDDAWRVEDALALEVGGPHTMYLLTTRILPVASSFAVGGVVQVPELGEQASIDLLSRLARGAVNIEPDVFRDLVQLVGGLPLALTLLGNWLRVQVRTGQSRRIKQAFERLHEVEERLNISLSQPPLDHHPSLPSGTPLSLQAAIGVSDQALDDHARAALRALAVLPAKPGSFSEQAACALIGGSVSAALDALDLLVDRGLVSIVEPERYSLHASIADYARSHLTDQSVYERLIAYGKEYAEAHAEDPVALDRENSTILTAFSEADRLGKWSELVEGVYAFIPYLLKRSRYSEAEHLLSRAYTIASADTAFSSLLTRILLFQGRVFSLLGRYQAAEDSLKEGMAIARKGHQAEMIASYLLASGTISMKHGRLEEAESAFYEGLEMARQSGDSAHMSTLLREKLGIINGMRGHYTQAINFFQECLPLAKSLGDNELVASLLNNLGVAANQVGDLSAASTYYREGLALARQTGQRQVMAWQLLNLGVVETQQGHYGVALQYLEEGMLIAREIGDLEATAFLLLNRGETMIEQQRFPEAEGSLIESLALSQKLRHQELIAASLMNLGKTTAARGDFQHATQFLQEGLEIARQAEDIHLLCCILAAQGELALQQKHYEVADEAFQLMLEQLPTGSLDLLAIAQYGRARVLAARGQNTEARELATSSLETYEQMGHKDKELVRAWIEQGCPAA
jgi:tetratricopeptide (TPR) repeat protein/transcriptional regulator with XRE-family HTH domain